MTFNPCSNLFGGYGIPLCSGMNSPHQADGLEITIETIAGVEVVSGHAGRVW
ncbi:hypothetical protein ACIQRW_34600 [Streptomyces sp. NPDC091287]|uniref:hypothetical protein n=1 Tax=Streptomyces sp. NPDC091287 TaxID=3365988 RepID=UPI0038229A63